MSKSGANIGEVATPDVGGVTLRRHALDFEAGRLMHVTKRVGARLRKWLRSHPDELPSEEFRETYKLYQRAVADLLAEQRQRAGLKPTSRPALSDADVELELIDFLRALPAPERRRLLEASDVIDVESTSVAAPAEGEEF